MRSLEFVATNRSIPERIAEAVQPTVRYLFTIESHVYAMAIAAFVLLAFFPFLVLILSLTRAFLPGSDVAEMVLVGVGDFLPKDPGLVSFVRRNVSAAVASRGEVEFVSIVALLISSQGIFMPLEVALNRLWGFTNDRSYWANQLVSFLFAIGCGSLAIGAAVFSSANVNLLRTLFDQLPAIPYAWSVTVLRLASLPFVIAIISLIYWKLPHGPVRFRTIAPIAVLAAVAVEGAHHVYLWAWPLFRVRDAYGPFFISVTLLLGGFVGALIILAGGEICVRRGRRNRAAS